MKRARDLSALFLVLGASVALWIPRLRGPIDLRYDAGVYYVLGSSLAQGRGYRLLNEPGAIEAIQYPPLLPLLVAAHIQARGTPDPSLVAPLLRHTYCLLTLAFAVATWFFARALLPPLPALFAALVTVLSLFTLYLSDLLFAELPFALLTVLFLLAARSQRRGAQVLCALFSGMAFLLRTAGLALLVAWAVEPLLERRFRAALLRAGVALLPVLLWQMQIHRVQSGPEYVQPAYAYQRAPYQYYNVSYTENAALVDPFAPEQGRAAAAGLAERALGNALRLTIALGESVSTACRWWEWPVKTLNARLRRFQLPSWTMLAPPLFLGVLVVAGAWTLARAGRRMESLVLVASLGLIALTPWPKQFPRYLMPLTPLTATALAAIFPALCRRRLGRLGVGALVVVVFLEQGYALWRNFQRASNVSFTSYSGTTSRARWFYYDANWQDFGAALDWLREHAERDAVLATSAPHFAHLVTGLQAVIPPLEADPNEAQRLLDSVPVDYVIVDQLVFVDMSRRYAEPVVRARPDQWEPVYRAQNETLTIWRRRR